MSDHHAHDDIGTAKVRHARRISLVWAIPVVTALIAGFLGYRTLSQQGPTIEIRFADGDGIEVGKTPVKYKNVQLGVVKSLSLADDLKTVRVTAQMQREAEPVLTENARFWVVKPRASITQISGLDTLLSGSYIAVDPGMSGGASRAHFRGLAQPPIVQSDVPGRTFVLNADRLGSLTPGAPLFFRDLSVGYVLGYDTDNIADRVAIHVFVRAPYDKYVHTDSNFWNASGIGIKFGADGVDIELESLEAVLAGGIAFDTPDPANKAALAKEGEEFTLYGDKAAALSSHFSRRLPFVAYFEGSSVRGLGPGSPVELYGITIGTVKSVSLDFDDATQRFRVPVRFEIEPGRIGLSEEKLSDNQLLQAIREMVDQGLRVQLRASNILTGQQVMALDFFPHARHALLATAGKDSVMPSMPPQIDNLSRAVSDILDKVSKLPLAEIADNLNTALKGASDIANSPDLKKSVASLSETLSSVKVVVDQMNRDLTPTLQKLPQMADGIQKVIAQTSQLAGSLNTGYGGNSKFKRDVDRALLQFTDTARSFRVLADLLSVHPEALILGRTGQETK